MQNVNLVNENGKGFPIKKKKRPANFRINFGIPFVSDRHSGHRKDVWFY